MRRFVVLFLLLMVAFVSVVQAQAPATAPKPDPELKKMGAFVGHWTVERDYKPSPLSPGGKVTGEVSLRWVLRGFFLEAREVEKGPTGETHFFEYYGYDPVNKTVTFNVMFDNGSYLFGTTAATEGTSSWDGKYVTGGKEYRIRASIVFAPDGKSYNAKFEISTDGKTWSPWWEGKYTKSEPTAKK